MHDSRVSVKLIQALFSWLAREVRIALPAHKPCDTCAFWIFAATFLLGERWEVIDRVQPYLSAWNKIFLSTPFLCLSSFSTLDGAKVHLSEGCCNLSLLPQQAHNIYFEGEEGNLLFAWHVSGSGISEVQVPAVHNYYIQQMKE